MTIERAIVVNKIDKHHYTVRIPTLNKSAGAVGSTPDNELYTACINTSPGISPAYNSGSAVYVAFEYDDCSSPVIIGALYNDNSVKIQNDINVTSLKVTTNVELPKDTVIGNVSAANIAALEGQTTRIKSQFETIELFQQDAIVRFNNISDTIIYMREHDEKADADAVRLAKRVTQNEDDIQSNADDISTHTSNNDIHVTATQKSAWNTHILDGDIHVTASQKSAWNTHISDTGIHVTATQKAAWNTHKDDDVVHITSTERTAWNNKADSGHTHSSFNLLTINSATLKKIILDSNSYGTSVPSNPTKGQLFFVLESE